MSQVRRWLVRPVIEHAEADRPFRLRRASLLLLSGGWATFLVSCLIGVWLVRHHVQLRSLSELRHGGDTITAAAMQWAHRMTEVLGAASFFAGLGSVALFDRRDRIPVWRAD